jgi:hypothetical protein
MKNQKPFRRGIVELSGEKCEVNYRFIDDDTIEMYADDLTYIGETHYKSLVEDFILPKTKKQFDESLFRAYINKFSDEDKLKCIEILMRITNTDKCHLCSEGFIYQ